MPYFWIKEWAYAIAVRMNYYYYKSLFRTIGLRARPPNPVPAEQMPMAKPLLVENLRTLSLTAIGQVSWIVSFLPLRDHRRHCLEFLWIRSRKLHLSILLYTCHVHKGSTQTKK